MNMGRHDFVVRYHNFVPMKKVGNVVLSKCNCCQRPRYGVYIAVKNDQIFYYHGYSYEEALKTFNFLVSKSQVK